MAKSKKPRHRYNGRKFIDQMQDQRRAEYSIVETWTMQLTSDLFCIGLNECFGIGEERLAKLCEWLTPQYIEYREALTKHPENDYLRDQIDRRLEKICKDKFLPWKQRYDGWEE